MEHPRTTALIVAAGSGLRMGGGPKQYEPLGASSVLAQAIDAFLRYPGIDAIRVVIGPDQHAAYAVAIGDRPLPPPIVGGATRRESVAAGLAAVSGDRVLIHDAARPIVPAAVIDRLLTALDSNDGAVPVLPVSDTLAAGGETLGPVTPRAGLVRVQTPQAFRLAAIVAAHAAWDPANEATDDAQMLRAAGGTVATVQGDPALDKLTHPQDLANARSRMLVVRVGSGFDVHAFAPGDHVILGGVAVPHGFKLLGHSDADVVLHTITDAILGAIGDGDIGDHFPPSDPQWKGAASDRFLVHARELLTARGGILDHVDVTIICEAPKVGPHRAAIRTNIARLLQLSEKRISVKATTTERLGFTGRGEGIAAQAVATVRLPEDE
ncbi:bifunctional 2-C-methyl-D-erythritol 4-phosphate cytidylyltransferase/2-C-methyl-D-erythritol 2,4-cyclodiphosphate synthase [Sphingomonas prati]|uniref:Bifunctional enzyme IspD/IspF n=1 Tax=Sphingomonas prati TaxID=1843237 RepID=A0A7W9F2I2_9SPHN|nr:bifunctional 2-C-methyl-D-erythritol 4-phosphate cytidylyltransferase/2-C-methyl-D-erythritol 2,4-cyclodiphosphate synthase [Sphingomonas prati]MBB5728525.1 2-C-methyl-D-erythritol 4-phosphate cytidylyltransferase/2-C-methyl-D-erythritol 2,4-cyclodiphosphate synthase [Sphingomonas prati]GGE73104.1 bifunctional enzyme IspD/IspF [Sphingomonas prati]